MNARAKISSKGQLVVPKEIRDAHGWGVGTELEFGDNGDEVVLRAVERADARFPRISMEELLSRAVNVDRFPTDKEMEETVLAEAARRFDAAGR